MVSSSALRKITPSTTSAIIRPSAKMPAPLNMRRTVTGPKPANNSLMYSGSAPLTAAPCPSVRLGALGLGRRQQHGFTAAAGRGLVRVVEHELRRQLADLPVHLGAEQEQDRLGIDHELHALVLDH